MDADISDLPAPDTSAAAAPAPSGPDITDLPTPPPEEKGFFQKFGDTVDKYGQDYLDKASDAVHAVGKEFAAHPGKSLLETVEGLPAAIVAPIAHAAAGGEAVVENAVRSGTTFDEINDRNQKAVSENVDPRSDIGKLYSNALGAVTAPVSDALKVPGKVVSATAKAAGATSENAKSAGAQTDAIVNASVVGAGLKKAAEAEPISKPSASNGGYTAEDLTKEPPTDPPGGSSSSKAPEPVKFEPINIKSNVPTGTLSAEDQAARLKTFKDLGLQEVRSSAVSGDAKQSSGDLQISKLNDEHGTRLYNVLKTETAALQDRAAMMTESSGGTIGLDQGARETRGRSMSAPINDFHDALNAQISDMYAHADKRAAGIPSELAGFQDFLQKNKSSFLSTVEGKQLLEGINARASELGLMGKDIRNPSAPGLIKDFESQYPENPANPAGRILNDNVAVELHPDPFDPKTLHIESVENLPGAPTGAGPRAMKQLATLADKHGVTVTTNARAFGSMNMPTDRLTQLYKHFGFEEAPADDFNPGLMKRQPGPSPASDLSSATFNPATVKQAEALRQYIGDSYTHRTGKLTRALQDQLDDDVTKTAGEDVYATARSIRAQRAKLLDEPEGVSQLINPKDKLGINRTVPYEDTPRFVTQLPIQQFDHLLSTYKDAAKISPELAEKSSAAINDVRAEFANQVESIGNATQGMWNAKGVNKYLRDNAVRLNRVFSPEEMAQWKTLDDAGRFLRIDRAYPGAAAQHHNFAVEGLMDLAEKGGTVAGATMGGVPGAVAGYGVSKATGAVRGMARRAAIERRVTKLTDSKDK